MSIADLEALALRAQATIDAKRKEEREQKAKDAKDIIPELGVFRVYDGKVYTRWKNAIWNGLLRMPVGGGKVEWNSLNNGETDRFSKIDQSGWQGQEGYSDPFSDALKDYYQAIGRLAIYAHIARNKQR